MPRPKDEFDEMYPDPDELPPWNPPIKFEQRWEPPLTQEELSFVDARAADGRSRGDPPPCCFKGDIERYLPEKAARLRAAEGDDWHRHETEEEYDARLERESVEMDEAIRQHNERDRQWVEEWREKKRAAARR